MTTHEVTVKLLTGSLVRMGLPGAADGLARAVYEKVRRLHLSLPPLADECPEWTWYEESWMP